MLFAKSLKGVDSRRHDRSVVPLSGTGILKNEGRQQLGGAHYDS